MLMSNAQNPNVESVEVKEDQVKLQLKGHPTPIILTAMGQDEGGERFYGGLDSVRFHGVEDTKDLKVAELLENNPIFNLHAVLDGSTLYIGTVANPVRIDLDGFYGYSIELEVTDDRQGFLPMKLDGDQWVAVQG
jgi:hypothetical protein